MNRENYEQTHSKNKNNNNNNNNNNNHDNNNNEEINMDNVKPEMWLSRNWDNINKFLYV